MTLRQQLRQRLGTLSTIEAQQEEIINMLEQLVVAVERATTAQQSANALITGLVAELERLAALPTVDPAQVQQLADALNASTDILVSAITANTPQAGG